MREPNQRWTERRIWIFGGFVVLIFILIEFRLFYIQVVNRPELLRQANANRLRMEIIEPSRGGIFDRQGRLLVENRPTYILYAHPWTVKRNPETITLLAEVLHLDSSALRQRIGKLGWHTFQPTIIQRDLDFAQLARLQTIQIDLPGIRFGFAPKRSYPLPEAVHLLGYVGERSKEETFAGQIRFGLVGKHGVEKVYEKWLGGQPGIRYMQVDAHGRDMGPAEDPQPIAPQRGWDLHLHIDGSLQRYTYELMAGRQGGVVALDPRDGSVLALLSLPDYDPTLFAGVMPPEVWKSLLENPGRPLLNRVVQGLYPPGSTYKMAVLAAGIEEGIATDAFHISCGGGMQMGNRFFLCWRKTGHGGMNWASGLQQSCDVFFYTLGIRLGVDRMHQFARLFGFGQKTRLDFDVEASGLAPSGRYLNKRYGTRGWSNGQAMNIAIGQGEVLVTPIQLAVYASAIATGNLVKPTIGDYLKNPFTEEIHKIEPEITPVPFKSRTLAMIREGMWRVINEPGGTAFRQKRPDIVMAGKTGTAQNPHGKDHALFVGFAPFDDPIIAVAVVVEHGEHGSSTAAPVACKMMERYIYDLYIGPRPDWGWVEAPKSEPDSLKAAEEVPDVHDE